jgi:hypothetical protein
VIRTDCRGFRQRLCVIVIHFCESRVSGKDKIEEN